MSSGVTLRWKSLAIAVSALVSLAVSGTPTAAGATAAGLRPAGPYSWWQGLGAGYYNLDQRLTIHAHSPAKQLFWAHQFGFKDLDYGGYIGLQMDPAKKFVRFSLWNATAAQGPKCQTFGGEGVGWTCTIEPYNWVPGRTYRLRVWSNGDEGTSRWWVAYVMDTVTGTDTYIARIRVPNQKLLVSQVSWIEYFGPDLASCADTPRAKAIWEFPTANNGSIRSTGADNLTSPTTSCPGTARVAPVPSGSIQEKGVVPSYNGCSGAAQIYAVSPGPNTSSGTRDLEVQNWRTDDRAPVQMWTNNPNPNNTNQRWTAECQSDGTWVLINKHSGKCLDEPSGAVNGTNVYQYTCHRGGNQRWWHDYRGKDTYGRDYWVMVNKKDLRCLDIEGPAWGDGVPAQVWSCYGGWNQLFWYWAA